MYSSLGISSRRLEVRRNQKLRLVSCAFRLVRTTPHEGGALRESHTEYTLEPTNGSNELATAAISFLSSSSLLLCLKKIFALRPCNVEWLDMNGKQVTYNTSTSPHHHH